MFVKKRDGKIEQVHFDKITKRISQLIKVEENNVIDPILIAQKVVGSIYAGITTEELDNESAKICINLCTSHYLYSMLAGRISISNLQKKTLNSFVEKYQLIQEKLNLLSDDWLQYIQDNREEINNIIDYKRDYLFDYFGFKTLDRAYLISIDGTIVERPQDMFMRVASSINMNNLEETKECYNLMSLGYYTHASPTLFNSGTKKMQLSSCFLLGTKDDLSKITKTWSDVAQISKWGGGIGLSISNIRAKDSLIRGTNGPCSGIIPMLKVYNEIARYVNQGGKRKGSIAIYLEPHHPDILAFLDLKKNFGAETERARDLFLAVWVSDLFMKLVEKDEDWYLMCPDKCPRLCDVYGEEYENLYWYYVNNNMYNKKIKAREVMKAILDSQLETGTPYITFKDNVNNKSNQKNIGVIRCSNLCNEIVQYSSADEYAVCNLASIAINKCVIPFKSEREWIIYTKNDCKYCKWAKTFMINNNYTFTEKTIEREELIKLTNNDTYPQIYYGDELIGGYNSLFNYTKGTFDYNKLYEIAYVATKNLNRIIDINYYPVEEAKKSNLKHRPIGLGIQGLADALVLLKIKFESNESLDFNSKMMETIYLAALTASNDESINRCEKMNKLKSYIESSTLLLRYVYYNDELILEDNEMNQLYHELKPNSFELNQPIDNYSGAYSSFKGSPISEGKFQFDLWNLDNSKLMHLEKWEILRKNIMLYGIRNSLVTALMPTASTSQILGNNECFEFFTNNIYTRRTLAGDFPLVNKYLIDDLNKINLWNDEMKQLIIANNGSIQNLSIIPEVIRNLYPTIWEIKQIWILKNAVARGPFVDQTQSMNIYMAVPDYQKLYSSHFWAWKNGLKTGIYYLRSKPAKEAVKVTIDPNIERKLSEMINEEICENCSA